MKKIAIFGSRNIDESFAYSKLDKLMIKDNEYITSGNIDGVAAVALNIAQEKGIKITLYNYESGLGFYIAIKDILNKNKKMIEACDEKRLLSGMAKAKERKEKLVC
ncbi:MAG: hypothetical protein LBR64_02275 [Dysgonamonadaceae bacterium]|jgi:hypothetical protein|nr:hypothetical protein [Dysgonamonadaceae bacterium]